MSPAPFKRGWIFLPVYFDVDSFLPLRAAIKASSTLPFTFVVLDDAAGRDPAIHSLREQSDITVVDFPRNQGHQKALVQGLRAFADKIHDDDAVITMDSDGQDMAQDVPRLLNELAQSPEKIVLALRTRRSETPLFKFMYVVFKAVFRLTTGLVIQNGNFAAYRGAVLKKVISRRTFDLCYSSSLIRLGISVAFVGCARGERIAGESRMTFSKLIWHGLKMMAPFRAAIGLRLALLTISIVTAIALLRAS